MLLAVALGAFGAHALEGRIDPARMELWRTAVAYHAWHALGLLALGALGERLAPRAARLAKGLLVAGIVLFSGSLYLLALTGWSRLGAVTPVGGVAWLVAWGIIVAATWGRAGRRDIGRSAEGG